MRYNIQHSATKEQILDDLALLIGHRYEKTLGNHGNMFLELVSEMRNGGATQSLEKIKSLRAALFELDAILEDSMQAVSGYLGIVVQENNPDRPEQNPNKELEDGEGRSGTHTASSEDFEAESQE
tara:strand:- start:2857 stop:3231 length:375 start_codon:yes stop_codon:yes gene_type:complete